MPAILFVCTANQFRSPIAAACFSRKLASLQWKGDWIIQSAGTWISPGVSALPVAIIAARKIGVSLEGHKARSVTPELVSIQDLILVMESGQKEALQNEFSIFGKRVFLLSEVALNKAEEIPDPVMFLSSLCRKQDAPMTCWQDREAQLYRYRAFVFEE